MTPERRLPLLVWSITAVFLLSLLMTVWAFVREAEAEAVERAAQRTGQLAASLETSLNRKLLGLDLLLSGTNDILRPAFKPTAAGTGDGGRPTLDLDVVEARHLLARMKARHPEFMHLALINADGSVLVSDLPSAQQDDLALPLQWVTAALQAPVAQLRVSDARRSSSGELVLYFLHPVLMPDGRRVLVAGEMPAALVSQSLAIAAGASDAVVTLERSNGRLLASAPIDTSLIGQALHPALTPDQLDGRSRRLPARLDAIPALVAARPAQQADLVVAVSLPMEQQRVGWLRDRKLTAGVTGAFALLVLAAAVMTHWQFRRLLRTRQALAHSHSMLNHALGAMVDGFLLCDANDCLVLWNERYVQLFPWLQPVLRVGLPFRALADTAAVHVLPDGNAEQRAAWVEMRYRLHHEANRAWEQDLGNGFVVTAVERRTPDGGVVSLVRDITAEERRLRQAKSAAEAANETKSRFLANMSHEIRTPLNAVLGLNALLLNSPLNSEQRRHAELIADAGQLLLALINDILDVSKIEAGRMALSEQPFDPACAAEEVVALLRERASEKGLSLTLTLAPGLPERVLADPLRVRQVMFNLVGNALKFTDHGSVSMHLGHRHAEQGCQDTSAGKDGDVLLLLTVRDTGIGIPADAMPHLFERFTQADNTAARRHGGSGLGLAIAKEVAEMMGGGIEVSSQPLMGSVFVATLRCRQLPHAEEAPAPTVDGPCSAPAPAPAPAHRRLQVLVAEDNLVNQVLIQAILQRMGHWAEIAVNGPAAVRAAQRQVHDLVLMDMQMPEMDGLDATRAIRQLPGTASRVPIVAMTANARQEDRQACIDAGMDDYVSKPIDLNDLARAIERAMCSAPRPTAALGN